MYNKDTQDFFITTCSIFNGVFDHLQQWNSSYERPYYTYRRLSCYFFQFDWKQLKNCCRLTVRKSLKCVILTKFSLSTDQLCLVLAELQAISSATDVFLDIFTRSLDKLPFPNLTLKRMRKKKKRKKKVWNFQHLLLR